MKAHPEVLLAALAAVFAASLLISGFGLFDYGHEPLFLAVGSCIFAAAAFEWSCPVIALGIATLGLLPSFLRLPGMTGSICILGEGLLAVAAVAIVCRAESRRRRESGGFTADAID